MLKNRYLIASLGILLLAVVWWNVSFFMGRRTGSGPQGGTVPSASPSGRAASRQKAEVQTRKEFPVPQDAAVWRRDPFTFSLPRAAEKKAALVPDLPAKEEKVNLQGIMMSNGKRFALVDGWVVGIGDRVRDYRVAEISQYGMVLKGERGVREVSIIHETVKEK
jgi:hypothetical protein